MIQTLASRSFRMEDLEYNEIYFKRVLPYFVEFAKKNKYVFFA